MGTMMPVEAQTRTGVQTTPVQQRRVIDLDLEDDKMSSQRPALHEGFEFKVASTGSSAADRVFAKKFKTADSPELHPTLPLRQTSDKKHLSENCNPEELRYKQKCVIEKKLAV